MKCTIALIFTLLIKTFNCGGQDVIFNDPFGKLYEFSLKDCSITLLSDTGRPLTDIACGANGILYGIDIGGNIFILNPMDGASSLIFSLPPLPPGSEYNSLTMDHNNILYALGLDGNLYFYDTQNSSSGLIADLNIQAIGDMVFMDKDNLLILASGRQLYRYNLATSEGSIEKILSTSRGTIFTNLVECNSPTIYSIQSGTSSILYQFDTNLNDSPPCNIINSTGVQVFGSAAITESLNRTLISIKDISVSNIICNKSMGEIKILAEGGYEDLNYSLNNGDYQNEDIFKNLLSGEYIINVNDAKECPISTKVTIGVDAELSFEKIEILPSDCNGQNGFLTATVPIEDNSLDSIYSSNLLLGSVNFGKELNLILDEGSFTLSNKGCGVKVDTSIVIPTDLCNFYIPNIFRANSEITENNSFRIDFQDPASVLIEDYIILDEWGAIIFARKKFPPTLSENWWTGMCSDKLCDQGVYTYLITFDLGRNVKRKRTGTVLLLN